MPRSAKNSATQENNQRCFGLRIESELLQLAVSKKLQGQGRGHVMLSDLRWRLSSDDMRKIVIRENEGNLEGQLFLRDEGFMCVEVEEGDQNIYVFEYHYVGDCV